MGNLTRDPELRHTQSGQAIAKFGMASNEHYGPADDRKQRATFVDCVAWGKQAELIAEHVRKGDSFFVEGRLEFSQWSDRESGKSRTKLEVVVQNFQFVGPKKDRAEAAKQDRSQPDYGDIPF